MGGIPGNQKHFMESGLDQIPSCTATGKNLGYGEFSGPSGEAGLPCILYVRTFVHHERDVLPRSMKIIVSLTNVRQRAGASIYRRIKQ